MDKILIADILEQTTFGQSGLKNEWQKIHGLLQVFLKFQHFQRKMGDF